MGATRETSHSPETELARSGSLPALDGGRDATSKAETGCLPGLDCGQAFFGPSFRVTRERGKVLSSKLAPKVVATVHPSSLLRQRDEVSRDREYAHFVVDLKAALRAVGEKYHPPRISKPWPLSYGFGEAEGLTAGVGEAADVFAFSIGPSFTTLASTVPSACFQ